jgi:hypothetical protein
VDPVAAVATVPLETGAEGQLDTGGIVQPVASTMAVNNEHNKRGRLIFDQWMNFGARA